MSDPFFDTNIIIDWLQRRPQAADELAQYGHHRISRIAWTEVLAGEPIASRDRVKRLIGHFEVIELDERLSSIAADIRFRMRIRLLDALIFATAQAHGAMLVTRNTRDFPVGTPGIRVPYTLQ